MDEALGKLTDRLGQKLNLSESGESTLFDTELRKTRFSIFEPQSDLGFFKWAPKGGYTVLYDIKSTEEVTKLIEDSDAAPEKLVNHLQIPLPKRFLNLPPNERVNKFPYGQNVVGALYVAKNHRKVELTDIDFCFGGSTLEMLANQDVAEASFYATKISGVDLIVVAKCKEYIHNLAEPGFQFERLLTGRSMEAKTSFVSIEHLHVMKVGGFSVLFQAEVDAIHRDEPVELTASNPRYWGSKKVFQMISNGSPRLCHGIKQRGALVGIDLLSLSRCASDAPINYRQAEARICQGMEEMQRRLKNAAADDVYKVAFEKGSLKLILSTEPRDAMILPPSKIVNELLMID